MPHPIATAIKTRLTAAWMAEVDADPAVLGYVLSSFLEIESNEEARFFDDLARQLDGPLRRAVLRQAADEDRHVVLVKRCLEVLGREAVHVPEEMRALPVISEAAGCALDGTLASRTELGRGVLMISVLERRMAERLQLLADAIRGNHLEIAVILDAIADDERRHVKYCRAVGRALLGDEAEADALLDHFTTAEASLWPAFSTRVLGHMLGLAERMGPIRRAAWWGVYWIAATFSGTEPVREDLVTERPRAPRIAA